jgi:hypothetical protein
MAAQNGRNKSGQNTAYRRPTPDMPLEDDYPDFTPEEIRKRFPNNPD